MSSTSEVSSKKRRVALRFMWEYIDSTELANMSKMPAKKKSCFQITSVTQAQVAANNTVDDTESQDDPDESRTEDVSSEIFDVSRVDLALCDRSSSEETLNNLGDTQEGQTALTAPVNEALGDNKSAGGGLLAPYHSATNASAAATAQPISAPAAPFPSTTVTPVNTCSSRFRVIKLDHGTGEPFRRGRWTCTEFHDKDSDSNGGRTVDSIKPAVTLDHSMERDSGIGTISNIVLSSSASSSQALENAVDSSHTATNPSHSSETVLQGFGLVTQIGSGASAFQPTGYSMTSSKQTQHAQVNMQPAAPQTFLSNNLKCVHQGSLQQKSPIPPPATQVQHFPYSNPPAGQPDYRQQQFGSNPLPHSVGPSSLILPAGSSAQGLGVEAPSAQGLLLHMAPGGGQQQLVNHTQPSAGLGLAPTSSATSGVQNVPVTLPATTNNPTGGVNQGLGIGGILQPQGAHGGATTGLLTGFSTQAEDGLSKSEVLPQPSGSVLPGKDNMKPFITGGLGLPSPAVNSLFGIHITMDGDEDSASGASVVAIDNKIEQAMDLVKSHLMYAVREEVEVLKEQIKELYERNSMLERENAVLKSLANSDQLNHLSNHGSTSPLQQQQQHSAVTNSAPLTQHEVSQSVPHQPNITSA